MYLQDSTLKKLLNTITLSGTSQWEHIHHPTTKKDNKNMWNYTVSQYTRLAEFLSALYKLNVNLTFCPFKFYNIIMVFVCLIFSLCKQKNLKSSCGCIIIIIITLLLYCYWMIMGGGGFYNKSELMLCSNYITMCSSINSIL